MARGQLSQAMFADLIGIPKNTIGGYERDERVPGADAIARMCKSARIDPNWLLFGEGCMRVQADIRLADGGEDRGCPHCVRLQQDLDQLRRDLREERAESRSLSRENRHLLRENADLRVELALRGGGTGAADFITP